MGSRSTVQRERQRLRRTVFGWGPAAVWAGVLFLLSSWENPGGIGLLELPDELLHLGVYSILGAALWWAYENGHPRMSPAKFWAIGWLYAASDEWHQSFVPGRTPALGDWIADAIGVVLGFGAALWLRRVLGTKRRDEDMAPRGSESIDGNT